MLTHREFSAWIVSEGKLLDEYQVTVDPNTDEVSCWIPGEPGKHFSVHWRDAGSEFYSCAFVAVDGFVVPVKFKPVFSVAARKAVNFRSAYPKRPFVFAEPTTPSGGSANGDGGMIGLKVKRIIIEGWRPEKNLERLPNSGGSQKTVSGHRVGLGRVTSTYEQRPRTLRTKPYERSYDRYITFVFRYKPKALLVSQGIIPAEDALRAHSSLPTMPNLCTNDKSNPTVGERQDSALQHQFGSGKVPLQSVTSIQTISTKRRTYLLVEGILDNESRQDNLKDT